MAPETSGAGGGAGPAAGAGVGRGPAAAGALGEPVDRLVGEGGVHPGLGPEGEQAFQSLAHGRRRPPVHRGVRP